MRKKRSGISLNISSHPLFDKVKITLMNLHGTEPIRFFGGNKPAFDIWEEGKHGLELK